MIPALKPCPFCGADSARVTIDGYENKWVCCEGCGVQTSEVGIFTEQQAADRWNKRAPAQPSTLEAKRRCLSCDRFAVGDRRYCGGGYCTFVEGET